MNELSSTTIDIHIFFILFSMILATVYLGLANLKGNFSHLIKRSRMLLPIYYASLSGIAFTGLVLLGVSHFSMSVSITFMILAWFIIFFLTIKFYKHIKKVMASNDDLVKSHFIWFMKRKWVTDIIILVILTLFAWRIGI